MRVTKRQIALYVENKETVPEMVRIMKSEVLTITTEATMLERDYIGSATKQDVLDSYKVSIDQDLDMYTTDKDYNTIYPYFYELKTGAEANTNGLIVFMAEKDADGKYEAWKVTETIKINNLDGQEGKLNFTMMLSDIEQVKVTISPDGKPTVVTGA